MTSQTRVNFQYFEAKLHIKASDLSEIEDYIEVSKFYKLLIALLENTFINFTSGTIAVWIKDPKTWKIKNTTETSAT